jgi:hypothetical protein
MDKAEINLRDLKRAVDMILDHVIEDLGVQKVMIEDNEDFFWDSPPSEMYDASKQPREWWTGRLSDDLDFIQKMLRSDDGYVAFMLNHASPLLRYVAKQVKECGPRRNESPKTN